VITVDRNVEIAMRDGTVLYADVYLPGPGRWPTLLQRTPYDKDVPAGTLVALSPMTAVIGGFAVVVQDVRGRGRSAGEHVPFHEGPDGHDTIGWIVAQPWSDGKVGMFGSSYHGATQLQAAVDTPPGLRAICPIQASSDYFEGRTYFGGALELGAILTTSLGVSGAVSLNRGGRDAAVKRRLRTGIGELMEDLPAVATDLPLRDRLGRQDGPLRQLTPWFFDWVERTDPTDPYWTELAIEPRYGSIDLAALHVTSWFDQFHVGTLRNYEGLRAGAASAAARENQYLIVGPWNHYPARTGGLGTSKVGDLTFGLGAQVHLDGIQLGWFGKALRGDDPAFRQRKRVRIFVMGADVWRDEDDWPLARQVSTPYYLDAAPMTLAPGPPAADAVARYDYDPAHPAPTHGGAHLVQGTHVPQGPVDQSAIDARADVVVFTSDELAEDLEVTGWIEAELWVRSSAPCTDFTVRLSDVHPDGRPFNVCDGISRIHIADPTQPARVPVRLGATAQLFRRGHRIRVAISSSNSPRFDLNLNTGGSAWDSAEVAVAEQQILTGPATPSRVVLPVIPLPSSVVDATEPAT